MSDNRQSEAVKETLSDIEDLTDSEEITTVVFGASDSRGRMQSMAASSEDQPCVRDPRVDILGSMVMNISDSAGVPVEQVLADIRLFIEYVEESGNAASFSTEG